ncbi:MAG: beta-eliminating lyase-related protein [Polyangiaceae bacterium]|jgi:threonine aldolase|nr:beta-eliminating lyase-related protein [Polyangiaceae bacterium]
MVKTLASDNFSGAHELVVQRMVEANRGHARAYGDDPWTAQARQAFVDLFEHPVETFFVFNGTGANVIALRTAVRPYSAVFCAESAHLYNDESTAPETFLGCRVRPLPAHGGRINPSDLGFALGRGHGVHCAKPTVLSLTEPTEVGTLYQPDELKSLVDLAHASGLAVHVDGARIGTALVALGLTPKQLLVDTGVDIVSFGGTKQGMFFGEAVVFIKPELAREFAYFQKQGLQLASKGRFIAAQFLALLENGLWLEGARHANAMARYLAAQVEQLGVPIVYPVQTNAVFAQLEPSRIGPLQAEMFFWPWDERTGIVRWMTTFDTTETDIMRFCDALRRVLAQGPARK